MNRLPDKLWSAHAELARQLSGLVDALNERFSSVSDVRAAVVTGTATFPLDVVFDRPGKPRTAFITSVTSVSAPATAVSVSGSSWEWTDGGAVRFTSASGLSAGQEYVFECVAIY